MWKKNYNHYINYLCNINCYWNWAYFSLNCLADRFQNLIGILGHYNGSLYGLLQNFQGLDSYTVCKSQFIWVFIGLWGVQKVCREPFEFEILSANRVKSKIDFRYFLYSSEFINYQNEIQICIKSKKMIIIILNFCMTL